MTTHPWRHARFVWAQRGAAGNLGFASRHASSFTGPPTLGRFKQTPVGRRVIRSVNLQSQTEPQTRECGPHVLRGRRDQENPR